MHYTGHIFGMKSQAGSIHLISNEDSQCYIWRANVKANFAESILQIEFHWKSKLFTVNLYQLKANYFTGNIISNGSELGKVYLKLYLSGNDLLLKGEWEEKWGEGVSKEDCLLELRLVE